MWRSAAQIVIAAVAVANGVKIPCFIKFLHHNNRLQLRVIVSFSDGQILVITCNGKMMILTPLINLLNKYP